MKDKKSGENLRKIFPALFYELIKKN